MKRPLFKFKYSMHGLNVNDYVVQGVIEFEQSFRIDNVWTLYLFQSDNNRAAMDRHRFLVCKPSPKNIIAIYAVVQELCSEIEQTTNEYVIILVFRVLIVNLTFSILDKNANFASLWGTT